MAKIQEDMQQRSITVVNSAMVENLMPPQGNPQVQIPTTTTCLIPTPVINHSLIKIDDQHNAFFIPKVSFIYDVFGPPANEVEKKVRAIEEKLKAMEGSNDIGFDATEMCLVPGVVIPTKFKVPDFEKYKGASNPRMHIRAYCLKMAAYLDNDRLLMHFFQDSLRGASLEWYMQLEGAHIWLWMDMVEAFLKHYLYNTYMAPSRTQLQNLTQKSDETFKEYVQH